MKDKNLCHRLIYLDAEFISRLYESEFDFSPQTQVTRTEGIQASASIAFFSGGGNSTESRSYSVSTFGMLDKLSERLDKYPDFDSKQYQVNSASLFCWVDGVLGISKVRLKRTTHTIVVVGKNDAKRGNNEELLGEEVFFSIKTNAVQFALSPVDQYFVSGIAPLKGPTHILIKKLSLPCRALIRVFSATTEFDEWIATPLIIYDRD